MIRPESYTFTAGAFIVQLVRYSRNVIRSVWLCTDSVSVVGIGEAIDLMS